MFTVFRPTRKKNGKSIKARTYRGRFTVGNDPRVCDVALRVTDKQVALQLLRERQKEMERERVGLIAPRSEREASKKPLLDLVEECLETKTALGKDDRYLRQLRCQLAKLSSECGWRTVNDISTSSFDRWRSKATGSAKTLNGYLNAASSFCSWLVKTKRMADNPLRHIERINTAGKATYERRALSLAEVKLLIEVSEARASVYVVAVYTGLRRQELKLLEWRDVHFSSPAPFVRLRAETTKSSKAADIPLHPDVLAALKAVLPASANPKAKVFPSMVPKIPRFNRDLEAANISLVGEDGRKVHFHSLRHTFCTLLQVHGASLREAQALMRHSEPRLTQIQYTDASQLPLAPAIGRLPTILGDSRIDSLNTSQTPVQSCPEVSARVRENEFTSLPQLHDGKPLVGSSVPRSPALSKNEKWCAIQGSNL